MKELATANALDAYLQTLEAEDYAKKTIHTRMGVVFSLLKDNKKETDVEYPSQLVSMPKPVFAGKTVTRGRFLWIGMGQKSYFRISAQRCSCVGCGESA